MLECTAPEGLFTTATESRTGTVASGTKQVTEVEETKVAGD
jgi:hypothetical protein